MDRDRANLIAHSCLIGMQLGPDGYARLDKGAVAEMQRHVADALIAVDLEWLDIPHANADPSHHRSEPFPPHLFPLVVEEATLVDILGICVDALRILITKIELIELLRGGG